MIKTNFYPLRSIVGSSVRISRIVQIQSGDKSLQVACRTHPSIYDAVTDEVYAKFLPDIIKDNVRYSPIAGMNTMPVPDTNILNVDNAGISSMVNLPIPGFENISGQQLLNIVGNMPDIPFLPTDGVGSVFGYQEQAAVEMQLMPQTDKGDRQPNHFYSGQDGEISFLISLEKEVLVGGMCFNGYPYISSRVENTVEGMTVGNFGLPREIKLTPLPSISGSSLDEYIGYQRSQFIDSEFAYTRQEILSHSGLNYMTIDPVKTNLFLLTITDLPFIPKTIDLDSYRENEDGSVLRVEGFKGFAIPYIWFFEYQEQTKQLARLHSGVLGVKPMYPHLPKMDGNNAQQDVLRRAFPEWEYFFEENKIAEETSEEIVLVSNDIKQLKSKAKSNPKQKSKLDDQIKQLNLKLKKLKQQQLPPKREGVYWSYSAHSMGGQRRTFNISYPALNYSEAIINQGIQRNEKYIKECFVSDLLQSQEKLIVCLQQAEEFERCVAGLKALFIMFPTDGIPPDVVRIIGMFLGSIDAGRNLSEEEQTYVEDMLAFMTGLPPQTNFCEKFRLRIFEIDPPDGMSPAAVDLHSKYASLLADIQVNSILDIIFAMLLKGIQFRRVSSSNYFALEFENTGEKPGQIAIHSLHLVRSANVSVQPRPAKTQQVKAMHYRLIGPELADDFSKLGNEGFNFSIDRVTGGQTKNVLYSAMSLLDLLHTGGARIHANTRRRAVEFEKTEVYVKGTPNYETRVNSNRSKGWRIGETGKGVEWDKFEIPAQHRGNAGFQGYRDSPSANQKFEALRSSEVRTQNEHLLPDNEKPNVSKSLNSDGLQHSNESTEGLISILNILSKVTLDFKIISEERTGPMLVQGSSDWIRLWRSLEESNDVNSARILGTWIVNGNPFGLHTLLPKSILEALLEVIIQLLNTSKSAIGLSTEPICEAGDRDVGDIIRDAVEMIPIVGQTANQLNNIWCLAVKLFQLGEKLVDNIEMPEDITAWTNFDPVGILQKRIAAAIINGLNLSINLQPAGIGATLNTSVSSFLPQVLQTINFGNQGSIAKQISKSGMEYSNLKNSGFDIAVNKMTIESGENKRVVTRDYVPSNILDHTELNKKRINGAEVMWQNEFQDIITGTIPLNFTLPATASKMNYRTVDDTIRVRFNSGFSSSIQVDFWFELTEENLNDDN